MLQKVVKSSISLLAMSWMAVLSGNQTPTVSPVFPEDTLPFRVKIEKADFELPIGVHSGSHTVFQGKWLIVGGRTNGMHTFNNNENNFPIRKQNTTVLVVDPVSGKVFTRDLTDPASGLNQHEIDLLSVTAPQHFNKGQTLYITGGYGVDSETGNFTTKDVLTAIDIPGLMHWVVEPHHGETAAQHIRFIQNPAFQVTGGFMAEVENGITLLVVGQDFEGFYFHGSVTQTYTQTVRRFKIIDDGKHLDVEILDSNPLVPDPNLRRRDLSVVPVIYAKKNNKLARGLIAYSGVFTPPPDTGVWTVPVFINGNGRSFMQDPEDPRTFKQAMNNYVCAAPSLFSSRSKTMYNVFLGGITFGSFQDGQFVTSTDLPFNNQVTTIRWDTVKNKYKQFLMSAEFPFIPTKPDPTKPLLLGASADFFPATDVPKYKNDVVRFDQLPDHPVVIGYIVGGIQSNVENIETHKDSGASPYVFKVIITKKG